MGWLFSTLDAAVDASVPLADARAHLHLLARAGMCISAAVVPITGAWMAGFAMTMRRAHIDRSNALRDALTGAGNRRSAISTLRWLVRSAKSEFGVIFVDLDGFKKINDVSGHAAGDAILQQVTARLKAELRANDAVCRIGGDEFVCIIAPPTTAHAVYAIAERLRRSVAHTYDLANDQFVLDCSVGVSVFPHDGRDAHVLLDRADRAMYSAKAQGGGVCVAEPLIERQLIVR